MHPDLSPHLHSDECNKLIEAFHKCHKDNKFGKFLGWCNGENDVMLKCLKQERLARRAANFEKAKLTQEKLRRLQRADKENGNDS